MAREPSRKRELVEEWALFLRQRNSRSRNDQIEECWVFQFQVNHVLLMSGECDAADRFAAAFETELGLLRDDLTREPDALINSVSKAISAIKV